MIVPLHTLKKFIFCNRRFEEGYFLEDKCIFMIVINTTIISA